MRLRLFHQLFLLIAGSALLAAIAMAVVLSFNLRSGFSYYLQAQDREQLEEFVAVASTNIASRGPKAFQPGGSLDIKSLIADMVQRGDIPNAPLPPPDGAQGKALPLTRLLPLDGKRPRIGRPPGGFARRLMMFDTKNVQVTGPPPMVGPEASGTLERPIKFKGKTVAIAKLLPRGRTPSNVDASFLKGQYQSAVLITLLLLALAAIPALLVARLGARRLGEMQKAATAIAQGDFTARVSVSGGDELSAMGSDINSMAESLANLDSSRRRWLAEISHELRTPLSVLVGELDALKDGIRPLNMNAVQSLSDEAQRMGRIVNDLHSLAISDVSGTFCKHAPCDAVAIVNRAHDRFAPAFEAAGIDLSVDCRGATECPVMWDQPRIGQMLANVLTNTLRYTNAPGRATLTLSAMEKDLLIQLDDSAPSVSDEHLARLFEPLYRAEAARDRASGGSGLGLAVSEAIVKAHKGSISVAKSDMGGLSVMIIIPRDPSEA